LTLRLRPKGRHVEGRVEDSRIAPGIFRWQSTWRGNVTKVLVIDDEASIRSLFVEGLSVEGYDVIATGDCHGVSRVIDEEHPDIVVLDIKMGDFDGLELLTHIRQARPHMPVILCSAYATFKNDVRSSAADDYVVKSVDLEELKTRIRMALEGRTSRL
jgi:DNA-binding response OmpR family regulator